MNTKLITALRTTATALENDTFYYDWTHTHSCNCGSLLCALTGKSVAEFSKDIPPHIDGKDTCATWSDLAGQYCPITGIPTQELFRQIMGFGLTAKDLVNLEYLDDAAVVARIDTKRIQETSKVKPGLFRRKIPTKLDYENKRHAALYMRAWADLLTEAGRADVPEGAAKEQPVEA